MSFIFCCCMVSSYNPPPPLFYVECLAVGTKIGCWGWGLELLYTRCFQERRLGLIEALACLVPLDAAGFCMGGSGAEGGKRRRGGEGSGGDGCLGEFGQLLSFPVIGVEAAGELLLGWGGGWVRIETARLELGGWMDRL